MKVIRLHNQAELRVHDEPDPIPAPDEQIVSVRAVGICGSDLHWLDNGGTEETQIDQPLVLGHEFAGTVTDSIGREIRVALDPAIPCGHCQLCQEGHPNLCINVRFAGYGTEDGALREKLAWPKRCCHPLPAALNAIEGAMLEPLGVALHAVDLGSLNIGMKIGVFGCGPIGMMIIRLAQLMGASQVVATDVLSHRLDAARDLGAIPVLASKHGIEREEVLQQTDAQGVDVAFEVAGDNAAVETAVECTRPGGSIVLVGIPGTDRTYFRASTARRKGLTIKFSRRMKHVYPRAIRLAETGQIDLESLVTHRFSIDDYDEAFNVAHRREGMKAIIELG
ncbi:zinc-binding dehydrogenase [Candidatus Neomarinimicrobiota bacterium]